MAVEGLDEATLARLREELLRHRSFLRTEIESQGADPDSDDVAFVDERGSRIEGTAPESARR